MSLSNLTVKESYDGDNSTTDFAITPGIIEDDSSEIKVYIRDESSSVITETIQVEGSDYTLTGRPDVNSQHTTVSFVSAPASTDKVIIIRQLDLTQELDATGNGEFKLVEHETAYDRFVAMIQQLQEQIDRTAKLKITSAVSGLSMDDPTAGYFLRWNSAANGIESYDSTQFLSAGQTEHSVTDGQSASDLTNETWDSTSFTSVIYEYEIERTSSFTTGRIALQYKGSTWRVEDGGGEGDASGVTFSVSQSGSTAQLRAALDSGAGNGTIKLKRFSFTA